MMMCFARVVVVVVAVLALLVKIRSTGVVPGQVLLWFQKALKTIDRVVRVSLEVVFLFLLLRRSAK